MNYFWAIKEAYNTIHCNMFYRRNMTFKTHSKFCKAHRETFKTLVRNKGNNFRIFSSNIQSINAKFDKLEANVLELEQMQFHYSVLCLKECWLKNNDDITQIQLGNYTSIVQGALSSTRGGLLMYIHETHTYKVLDNHFKFDTWEYQLVVVRTKIL